MDGALRGALLDRAQGNPFFLAELLHLLVDRGVLRREDSGWVLEGTVPEDVLPAGVQAVLAARIDGLDGTTKGVLRDASVVGLRVTAQALEAVGAVSGHGQPDVVRAAVGELLERRLLEPEADGGYRFAHTLVRDVAYAGLAKSERARRHAAVAQWAQHAGGAEADLVTAAQGERAVRLAAEMTLAPSDPAWSGRVAAFDALARLGHRALGRDDSAAAEQVLSRALALRQPVYGPPLPADLVVPVQLAHAEALAAQHRLEEAEGELLPALEGAAEGARAGALLVLGDVRRKRGDLGAAREAFVQALATSSEAGLERLSGQALRQLGLLDYFEGRLGAAEQRFAQAHRLAEQTQDTRGAGWALQHLAWSATTRGDYGLADRTLARATEVFGSLEDSGGLAWVAGTEGFVRLLEGRFTEARELAGVLLPAAEQQRDRWGVAALLTIDAVAAAELGDVVVAAAEAERARARFAEIGDSWGQSLALVAAGISARGADLPDRAVDVPGDCRRPGADRRPPADAGPRARRPRVRPPGPRRPRRGARVRRAGQRLPGRPGPRTARRASEPGSCWRRCAGSVASPTRRSRSWTGRWRRRADPGLLFPRRQALAHRAGVLLELGRVQEAVAAARLAVDTPGEDVRSQVLAWRALGAALRAVGQEAEAVGALTTALDVSRSTGQRSEVAASERALRG